MTHYILTGIILLIVFCMGTVFFSFVNELRRKLPEGERPDMGNRQCPYCGHKYRFRDTIPVAASLFHKGRCMYCSKKLPLRDTLVEVAGGLFAVAAVIYYKLSFGALTVFIIFSILTAISVIDWDTQYIPPELNVTMALVGVISIWTLPGPTVVERLIGAVCISVPLLLIVLVIPEGFGGGDIKMMAAAGVLLGWKATVTAFFVGLLLGGAYGAFLLVFHKKGKKEHFAFGPFLSIGIAFSLYAGTGTMLMNGYIDIIKKAVLD